MSNKGKHWKQSEKARLNREGKPSNFKGKKHTIDSRERISKNRKTGKHSWNYIEDRNLLSKGDKYRNTPAHREWSKNVKKRDGWKCRIHNHQCSGKVNAHHILSWAKYPELRYKINNGITLCHFHHPKKRIDEEKLIPILKRLVEVISQ